MQSKDRGQAKLVPDVAECRNIHEIALLPLLNATGTDSTASCIAFAVTYRVADTAEFVATARLAFAINATVATCY